MAVVLPRFVVVQLKCLNGRCLRYMADNGETQHHLKFSDGEVVSPLAKFEIHASTKTEGLVHIRCCYNNKYLVVAKDSDYIVAAADKPVEDRSERSCTLFKPSYWGSADDSDGIHLRHVGLNNHAWMGMEDQPFDNCLRAGSHSLGFERFTIIDWESLVILPRYVAFKGANNLYLRAHWQDGHEYHKFSAHEVTDEGTVHEVFTNPDGTVRIKNVRFGRFWRRSPNWIWADSIDNSADNKDTVFQPVKLGHDVIALRNLGNNNFCVGLSKEWKEDCLNADAVKVYEWARMKVEEPVFSRKISNVMFRVKDARICNERIMTMATTTATNHTQNDHKLEVSLTYKKSKINSWRNSVSLSLGVKATLTAGIPKVHSTKIEISHEKTTEEVLGESREETKELTVKHPVVVPPMKKVTVSMLATSSYLEIPFSYTQSDKLYDGRWIPPITKNEGLYCHSSSYNTEFKAVEEDISPTE